MPENTPGTIGWNSGIGQGIRRLGHTYGQIVPAYQLARAAGWDPLGIDELNKPQTAAGTAKGTKSFEDMLREYYEELNGPLDLNDPEIRALLDTARSQSQANASARGVNGAASVRAGEDSYLRAAAGMRHDRMGMAGNALGMGLNAEQRNRDRAYEDSWRRWEQGVRGSQGMGQTIGAGLGAALGTFALPGLGTAAGAQIGAGIGGGIGNFAGGGLRPPSGNYSGGY